MKHRLGANTGGYRATLSLPINYHKPSNNVSLRVIWRMLWCTVEQGWLVVCKQLKR
jgi:hypothetical protein